MDGQPAGKPAPRNWPLALAALGIVFGDIGTSPLYAFRECFAGPHAAPVATANLIGAASLIVWSLLAIVAVKYVAVILRLDNKGEGGILALAALVRSAAPADSAARTRLFTLGLFGAALIYADGILTPSISVLSAVEGLTVVAPALQRYVVPAALAVLLGLFAIQRHGSGRVGRLFGPVILLWFVVIAAIGLRALLRHPAVLLGLSPHAGLHFLVHEWRHAFPLLSAVFLSVTGGEALYADLGHFGRLPIRLAWFTVVFPALVLNYLGQAALLTVSPEAAAGHPFFELVPPAWALPLTILATLAAIIASQALISGAFSLTSQAIQLGCLPRMLVRHTSATEKGQVYLPVINWLLMGACLLLVAEFESSAALAGAYGIAIALTMTVTSLLFYAAARRIWGWSRLRARWFVGAFLVVDLAFLAANSLKVADGGWLPLGIAAALAFVMSTWRWGRARVAARIERQAIPIDVLLGEIQRKSIHRVPGTAVFMSGKRIGVPTALLHNLKHNHILHERVLLLHVETLDVPAAPPESRAAVESLGEGIYHATLRFGFSESPDVPAVLKEHLPPELPYEQARFTFFLGRESFAVARDTTGVNRLRLAVFAWLSRNSSAATAYFRLPPSRVVELGAQLTI